MEQAASLGIYVLVPLTRGDWGFLPALPSPQCYHADLPDYGHVGLNLLTSAKLIVDQFSQFETWARPAADGFSMKGFLMSALLSQRVATKVALACLPYSRGEHFDVRRRE